MTRAGTVGSGTGDASLFRLGVTTSRAEGRHDGSAGDIGVPPVPAQLNRRPTVDPIDRIDAIIALAEGARSVPMSRNCMIDRGELINLLDQLRGELPGELRRSVALLEERDKILEAGRNEAERIITEGEAEHARLVSINEITVSAEHEAARIVGEARSEAQRLREEVDDYVDTALANFEQFLTRSLASIERGRDKMHALREIGSFVPDHEAGPLPL
jgi:vacuolar-type H+-ATPase subunit H